jgi:hypothetical protein
MSRRFRSRVDAVIGLFLLAPIVISGGTIVSLLRAGDDNLLIPGAVLVTATALVAWLLLDTSYTITERELLVRGGPVRMRIPLASIRRVRRSTTLLSGPALSLRRLEIDYGTAGLAIISPAEETAFLTMLGAAVPEAELPAPSGS